jgi:hypothetical protein
MRKKLETEFLIAIIFFDADNDLIRLLLFFRGGRLDSDFSNTPLSRRNRCQTAFRVAIVSM